MQEPKLISPSLLARTALEAAPLLLGQTLVRVTEEGEIRCRIVETESYGGAEDRGSHAFGNRRTNRTEVMFAAKRDRLCLFDIRHVFLPQCRRRGDG